MSKIRDFCLFFFVNALFIILLPILLIYGLVFIFYLEKLTKDLKEIEKVNEKPKRLP